VVDEFTRLISQKLSGPELLHYSCNTKTLYKPKIRLISPIFENICLKLGEKTSQLTLLCLAFDGFTLRYADDLVLNSTVSSQIIYLCHNRQQDNWCSVEFIFKVAKRRADEINIVLP